MEAEGTAHRFVWSAECLDRTVYSCRIVPFWNLWVDLQRKQYLRRRFRVVPLSV